MKILILTILVLACQIIKHSMLMMENGKVVCALSGVLFEVSLLVMVT